MTLFLLKRSLQPVVKINIDSLRFWKHAFKFVCVICRKSVETQLAIFDEILGHFQSCLWQQKVTFFTWDVRTLLVMFMAVQPCVFSKLSRHFRQENIIFLYLIWWCDVFRDMYSCVCYSIAGCFWWDVMTFSVVFVVTESVMFDETSGHFESCSWQHKPLVVKTFLGVFVVTKCNIFDVWQKHIQLHLWWQNQVF